MTPHDLGVPIAISLSASHLLWWFRVENEQVHGLEQVCAKFCPGVSWAVVSSEVWPCSWPQHQLDRRARELRHSGPGRASGGPALIRIASAARHQSLSRADDGRQKAHERRMLGLQAERLQQEQVPELLQKQRPARWLRLQSRGVRGRCELGVKSKLSLTPSPSLSPSLAYPFIFLISGAVLVLMLDAFVHCVRRRVHVARWVDVIFLARTAMYLSSLGGQRRPHAQPRCMQSVTISRNFFASTSSSSSLRLSWFCEIAGKTKLDNMSAVKSSFFWQQQEVQAQKIITVTSPNEGTEEDTK